MKSLNSQKPDQAQDAIVTGAAAFVLISVTLLLFYFPEEKQREAAHKKESTSTVKKQPSIEITVTHDPVMETGFEKPRLAVASVIKTSIRKPVSKSTQGIAPPLPLLNVQPLRQKVNAGAGETITTPWKSKIIVPPNAFLDGKGKVVEGNVDLRFREFHDFHQIFLSGIPMKYDSAGSNQMLESAGMAELTASKDNQPVYVNPESKIRIMLASVTKAIDYNLYYYDQKKSEWTYKGKDEVVITTTGDKYVATPRKTIIRTRTLPYVTPRYNVGVRCVSDMNEGKKFFFSKVKVTNVFDFRFFSCYDLDPALKELRGITWRYYGDDSRALFEQVFGPGKLKKSRSATTSFNGRAKIVQDGNEAYHLELEGEDFNLNIPVEPLIRTPRVHRNFDRKWGRYLAVKGDQEQKAAEAVTTLITDTVAYNSCFGNVDYEVAVGQELVLRSFAIDGFGIWNCDHPFKPAASNKVNARFTDEKGNLLTINSAYMVEKDRNSVYNLVDFQNFRFNPNVKNLCWAVLPGNKIAIIYPDEFDRHAKDKKGPCTFVAKVNDTALQNNASLRAALKFD